MENWFKWISAFAGMTEPDPRFVSFRPRLFDGQGIFLSLLFDEHQSPSFLRKQESKGNGHPTRKADKKMEASGEDRVD